ncbi:hypothetical protein BSIN_0061 [Burkholderia singularis]|uniref:Uncharacterized protein n=1 Tax=Burkholderia singularis TaxID=1503053 RepID=A0A238H210_9BURK|nr:hypothetical protein BSIN_0061 [Burkholderia singularis]
MRRSVSGRGTGDARHDPAGGALPVRGGLRPSQDSDNETKRLERAVNEPDAVAGGRRTSA